jgi:CHAD domain-containing protein
MRVATRRLRAVLEIFGPAFPKGEVGPVLRDVKALADALGARRDPDVAIAGLERFAAEAPRADGPGAESLIAALRAEQDAGNEILAAALERARDGDLQERLEDLVGEARG